MRPCRARRGLVRSVRTRAAAALLALTGALAVPQSADAQTVATLVSNTGETVGNEVASIGAQPFTTGSAAVLASVDIRLGSSSLAGPPRVRILRDASGSPGGELVTLVNPSSIVNEAVNNFTAPANTTLFADTTYYVELTRRATLLSDVVYTTGRRYRVTGSDDQTGLTNWNIGDSRYFKSATDVSWNTSGDVMMIAIKGTVVADTPTLSIADASGTEGDGVEFTATLTAGVSAKVTATWTASIGTGDTAVAADLATTKTGDVEFEADATTTTFTVPVTDDSTDEDDETFTVTLSNVSSNAQLAADPTAKGTITDDDNLPELAIGFGGGSEASVPALSVSLTPASGREVMVTWTATIESHDTAEAADFTDLSTATGTVTIPAGQSSILLFVPGVIDDSLDEDNETFTLTLSSPVNATLSTTQTVGRVTIRDDDDPPTVTVADGTASEGDKVEFVVTLSAESGRDVEVDYATSVGTGQTATSGTDFTAASSTLTIEEGDETGTIEVQTTEDSTEEEDETFTLTISDPANATLGTKTAAKGTIEDNDGTTTPTCTLNTGDLWCGVVVVGTFTDSGGSTLGHGFMGTTGGLGEDVEDRKFTVASTSNEYTITSIVVGAGSTSGALVLRLDDALMATMTTDDQATLEFGIDTESDPFPLSAAEPISNGGYRWEGTGLDWSSGTPVTVRLREEDPPTLSVADAAGAEGDDKVVFTVTLSKPRYAASSATWTASIESGDTAVAADLGTTKTGTVAIAARATTATFEVPVTDDSTDENDETFTVTLSAPASPESVKLATDATAKGTINDDDGTLTPTTCTLNTGDVWCGAVTVGTQTAGTITTGHGFSSITGDSFGTLTDNSGNQTFTHGTQTYVVSRVVVGAGTNLAGILEFRVERASPFDAVLDDDHRAKLALHVAGSTTPFAFRDTTGYTSSLGYVWSNSGLDWSSATTVTVRLRELPDAPTGFEAAVGNAQVALTWNAPASGANITRHEFRYKTVGSYPTTWTAIATSAPGGTNQASFTVTGLTNEIAHTFELRAVNDSGGSAAVEDGPVTPTPGICGRTPKIQEVILAELAGVTDCAAVTVANLASITTFGTNGFGTFDQGITSLLAGDFGGLTGLTLLKLNRNQLTSLPEGIFSGLTAITEISLNENQLTSLPEGTFAGLPNLLSISLSGNNFTQIPGGELSGVTTLTYLELTANKITELPAGLFTSLTALDSLYLGGNDLETLDAGVFSRLSALEVLNLNGNELESLPDGLLSALSALESLELKGNDLNSLDAGVFSGLSALEVLKLSGNELESLPDGLLSGLSALDTLELHGNTVDPLPLTVTVEKVGTDQARAEVLAGAPVAVAFKATVANGSLAGGATTLGVAAGSVEGTPVTVTRTSGTTESVTVDIDLSTQPSVPANHTGYEFVKATSGLPAGVLPAVGNNAPVFDPATAEREVPENSAAGTNVGAVIPEATDADNDTLTYSLEGGDARLFAFNASTRRITTRENVTYNYEAKSSYSVRVKASDGTDSATLAVTIGLTDVAEQSARPAKPRLSPVRGSTTSLSARWTRPGLNGGPAITGYDVQYREAPAGGWREWAHGDATVTTTITGLTAGGSYQARVRAKNGERDSEWSEASEAVVPSAAITPTVAAVSVTSVPELERDTYGRGETIRFTVEFSEKVSVAGRPHFTFSLGNRGAARRVDAAYESGSGMAALVFAYTVREGDEDDNGIFLMDGGRFDDRDGPVALADGAITAVEGGAAADLSWSGGGTERGHKVDGSRALEGDAPTVVGRLKVTSWPVRGGAAYGVGDTIVFTLTFSEKVRVKGQPQPALVFELGGEEREARYHGLSDTDYEAGSPAPAPRSEAVKLHFEYRVGAGDRDDDGVSVGADAVRPGDATIRSAVTGFDADLSHAAVAPDPDHRVAAGTATEPAGPGVTIIDAKGNPLAGHRLVIPEGGQGRYGLKLNTRPAHPVHLKAIMSDGDEDLAVLPSFTQPSIAPGAWGAPRWVDIAAADDADSVDGERVFLHRVHSKDPAYNDLLLPDVVVVEADDDPKPTRPPPPEITAVAVASEPELESDTYGYGETIRFRVEFSEPVTVGGQPHFTFSLGNRNAGRRVDAPYESGNRTTALVFGYEVQRGDEDDNGIFLLVGRDFTDRAGPVGLGRGGLILAVEGGVAADLAHDTGRGAQRGHKVDGLRPLDPVSPVPTPPTNPTVDSLAVNSWPQSGGDVYRSGDTIVFTVTFSEKVRVEKGQPALAFDLGGARHWGVYHGLSDDDYEEGGPAPTPRSEAAKLHFAYQVDRFDRDADGVEVGELSGAMDLRRGTIRSAETGLDADLGHAAVGPLSDPVDGLAAEPATTAEPLTAEFEGLPSEHDGETAFRFRIAFSEEVAVSAAAMRDDALAVTGGTVTGAARVDGRADRWSMEVTPSGRGEIGISLAPGRDCAEAGAVCTADGRPLTAGLAALVAGPPVEPLTASFEGMPAEHGGEGGLHFRVAFSEDIGISYRSLREDAFAVSGGRVTGGRRVDDRRDLFRMTVRPDSDGDVTITLPAGRECGVSGAICTKGDDRRQLTNSPSVTVTGPVGIEVADARVEEGDGAVLAFLVTLSRAAGGTLTVDYATANGSAHAGVDYRAASGTLEFRAGESSKTVEVAVFDDSHDEGEETLTLRLSNASSGRVTDGEATGTIKNTDPLPRALLARFGRTAAVQVVEQVEARLEASREPGFRGRVAGRELRRGMERDIALGLIRRLGGAAGVGRGVGGGGASGAMAGASGAAGFLPPGPSDGRRRSAPALPMRAAGSMGAVATGGASGSTGAGSTGGAAGSMGMAPSTSAAPSMGMAPSMRGASGSMGMGAGPMGGPMGMASMGGASHPMGMGAGPMGGPMGMAGPMGGASGSMGMATRRMGGASGGDGWLNGRGFLEMGLGGGDVLTGSAFTLNRESGRGGVVSLWSRGARSRFSGREGALSLGGDVRTTMFGADYARGPLVVGLSLSNTRGLGEYSGPGSGRMLSSVTGLYPWLGYRATDRITVWGVTGYGVGGMLLTPGGGPALESGLSTAMAAAGTRGELVGRGGGNGFALAFKADALWAGTGIDGVDGPEGRLVATSAAVTRVRTGLEGSRGFTLGGALSLRPSVEVGLRHDGGDAETGAGVDVGGGLVASHASSGLAVDVRVRTLLVHEAEGFSERGVSLSLSWNPTPSTPLGLRARLAPSWGGQATSGADALWGRDTMAGLGAPGGLASGNRLDAELGYGLPVGRRFVGTPRFGLRTAGTGRDYRLGYGLGVLNAGGLRFELGVDAQRRESPLAGGASNGVVGRVAVQW